jgi:hypothetical protein
MRVWIGEDWGISWEKKLGELGGSCQDIREILKFRQGSGSQVLDKYCNQMTET